MYRQHVTMTAVYRYVRVYISIDSHTTSSSHSVVASYRMTEMTRRSSAAAFTKLNLSLGNKELRVQIIIARENEPGRVFEYEPLIFLRKVTAFHTPCELDFSIKSTTDDFREIFSKGLLEIFLLLKLKTEWKQLINDYECYLKRRYSSYSRMHGG